MPLDQPPLGNPFDLPEATRELQETALAFAREVLAPKAVEWDQARHFPVEEMRQAAALGMAALYVREESGGAGLTRLDAAVVFEALSTGCPTVAAFLSIHNMVAWMIDRFGNDSQRAEWLPELIPMRKVASYCLTEPGSGSDAAALRTRARREGGDYVLDGVKQFISGAGAADLYLTMVRTGEAGPGGVSALLIPKETPGLSFGKNEHKMGWNAQPTRQVILEGARVPATALLGEEGEGFRIAMRILDRSRPGVAAQALGIAQGATDYALEYAKTRETMGRPIAQHQLIQAKLADMETECEAARGLLYRFGRMVDDGVDGAELTKASAMAKLKCGDVAMYATTEAVQILGGYGYIKEYPVERFMRDAKITQIYEGTQEVQRLVIAREMLKESRAFLLAGVG